MGGEYQAQPQGTGAIAKQLRELRADIANVQRALRNIGLQVDTDTGQLVVPDGKGIRLDGGAVEIYDADGHKIGLIGTSPGGAAGIAVGRGDGTVSFQAVTTSGGFAAFFDRVGDYIVTDDTTSGQGLARPYIPLGVFADNTPPTATTTSGSFTTLQTLVGYKQHPKVTMQLLVQAQSAGEVRVIDQAGNQIGSTATFAAGDFEYVTIQGAIAGAHMLPISLNVQARITSGSSPIGVRGVAAWAVESAAF